MSVFVFMCVGLARAWNHHLLLGEKIELRMQEESTPSMTALFIKGKKDAKDDRKKTDKKNVEKKVDRKKVERSPQGGGS